MVEQHFEEEGVIRAKRYKDIIIFLRMGGCGKNI